MASAMVRGIHLHYQVLGEMRPESPTVVFVHGIVMDNLSSWYFTVATHVSPLANVLLYDLRGHGLSERPPTGYSLDDMVLDLVGLLDSLQLGGPVYIVGNSFGGLLALAFAAAHPQRCAGLVLVDPHVGTEGFGDEMAATLGLTGEARDQKIATAFKAWLGRHSERKRNRLADAARKLIEGTSIVPDLRSTQVVDNAAIQHIRCPVLALYGERSDLRGRGEALLGTLSTCKIEIFNNCTHSILWEATDAVRDRIVAFVDEHASPASLPSPPSEP